MQDQHDLQRGLGQKPADGCPCLEDQVPAETLDTKMQVIFPG